MERRVRRKSHARCGVGENPKIASKDYLSLFALPDMFDKLLATMRSREISVSIILQNMAQLKALYEKEWESIVGNCDEFLYLGGNEQSSHKYVSELLGKETIDTNTYGRTRGRNGSYSTNLQITGRELMTPDEVRLMDNRYAILFIRGEHPVMNLKYDILKHPNVEYSTDGEGKPYEHGQDNLSVVSVELSQDEDILMEAIPVTEIDDDIIFLTDEELEKHIEQHGGINFDEL